MKNARERLLEEAREEHVAKDKSFVALSGRGGREVLKPISCNVPLEVVVNGMGKEKARVGQEAGQQIAPKGDDDENAVNLAADLSASPVAPAVSSRNKQSEKRRVEQGSRKREVTGPDSSSGSRSKCDHSVRDYKSTSGASSRVGRISSRAEGEDKISSRKPLTYAQIHGSPQTSPGKEKAGDRSGKVDQRRATLSPGKMKAMLEQALADDTVDDDDSCDEEAFLDCPTCPPADVKPADSAADIDVMAAGVDSHMFAVIDITAAAELGSLLTSCDDDESPLFDTSTARKDEVITENVLASVHTGISPAAAATWADEAEEEENVAFPAMIIAPDEISKTDVLVDEIKLKADDVPIVEVAAAHFSGDIEAESSVDDFQSTAAVDAEDIVVALTEENQLEGLCPRERARCRLFLRLEVARWKHAWEMVSLDAIESAARKTERQQQNSASRGTN